MARHKAYDPEKVKELRMLLVEACVDVMNGSPKVNKWGTYKKEMILKMSHRIVPQLTEVSGADGSPLVIKFHNAVATQESRGGS